MADHKYSSLLHSPHNKRKSYSSPSSAKKGRSKSKKTPSPTKATGSTPTKATSSTPTSAARRLDLKSPTRKLDLKSPRYFTSPENEEYDYKYGVARTPTACPMIAENESPVLRKVAIDRMIKERRTEDKSRSQKWESRKNKALLDAGEVERDLLKDILFNSSVDKHSMIGKEPPTISITRHGPVYKELLASPRTSPRLSPEELIKVNNLTMSDNSEIENDPIVKSNKKQVKVRAKDVSMSVSTQSISPIKKDMSSSYKEEDFSAQYYSSSRREDKSINTSPVRLRTPSPAKSPVRSPVRASRRKSPVHSERSNVHDTLDTVSELVDTERPSSPKKVSFMDDTDKSLKINRLENDVQRKDMEMMELRHNSLALQKKLGELETIRIALESDKLHQQIQNITHCPRPGVLDISPGYAPPAQGYAPPAQGHATPAQGYAPPAQGYVTPGITQTPKQNINTAYEDISEVNSMLHKLKTENQALQASLKQATIQTQLQTQLLEERLTCLTKERDNFATENKRYQRIIAQDDKGSRIALLQRDLQTQMSENDKLKTHLQILRESYTKFFGGTI